MRSACKVMFCKLVKNFEKNTCYRKSINVYKKINYKTIVTFFVNKVIVRYIFYFKAIKFHVSYTWATRHMLTFQTQATESSFQTKLDGFKQYYIDYFLNTYK